MYLNCSFSTLLVQYKTHISLIYLVLHSYSLNEQDYDTLAGIWERSVMSTHNFQSEEDFIEIKGALIPDCFPNVDLYAIAYNGVYIGFIGLSQGTIEMLFIDGDCRGQGVWICTY